MERRCYQATGRWPWRRRRERENPLSARPVISHFPKQSHRQPYTRRERARARRIYVYSPVVALFFPLARAHAESGASHPLPSRAILEMESAAAAAANSSLPLPPPPSSEIP